MSVTAYHLRSIAHLATPARILIALCVLALGLAAPFVPLLVGPPAPFALGLILLACGVLQILGTYTIPNRPATHVATAVSLIIVGLLLISASKLVFTAMAALIGITWVLDGLGKCVAAARHNVKRSRAALLFDGGVNLLIGLAIAIQWPVAGDWSVYPLVGLRLLAAGWSLLLGREQEGPEVEADETHSYLALPPLPAIDRVRKQVLDAEVQRYPADTYWILVLLVIFFAVHMGRLEAEWTLVGLISPAVAVAGDIVYAMGIAYLLVLPVQLLWRGLTLPLERRAWQNLPGGTSDAQRLRARFARRWLFGRMRLSIHLSDIRRSPALALRRGLQVGLPPTAVLIAVAPLLGVSWYFNTETWATGAWERWAEHRADGWREGMSAAVGRAYSGDGDAAPAGDSLFRVVPADIAESEDFSFIVIGDTGEGDASQHVLRDQYLRAGQRDDVKFLVVSSDVIYPQGAMRDYEAKFYLPFKGFEKPIYAIPGNHDWYDALEAFAANFFEPRAARAAINARRRADLHLTTTTDARVERMIAQAESLRNVYGVRNGTQRAPFFEIQTPHFALIAVDTGIRKTIDPPQLAWLRDALLRSQGKFIMVLAGHPLYAGGHYAAEPGSQFAEFHQLLRDSGARLVMAGDTHDLEFYLERFNRASSPDGPEAAPAPAEGHPILHVVNGGGGAYLSIGTALGWPDTPALPDYGFYPRADAIRSKLDAEVPLWKRPLWWWTRDLNAWPSSPEMLASAFASNIAPFFQSFIEVRVEPRAGRVRLLPYGASGRLRWRELDVKGAFAPGGPGSDEFVEISLPLITD
jgi:uncharacterized membrane protein HdeD (DUF308 family)